MVNSPSGDLYVFDCYQEVLLVAAAHDQF